MKCSDRKAKEIPVMATTPAQIDLWMQSRSEHQRLEFKEAKTQYDNTKLVQILRGVGERGRWDISCLG